MVKEIHRSRVVGGVPDPDGRGAELKCYFHTSLLAYLTTDVAFTEARGNPFPLLVWVYEGIPSHLGNGKRRCNRLAGTR